MEITLIKAIVKNLQNPQKSVEEEFLVDSGAVYSVLPKETLEKLEIKPHRKQTFTLADGTKYKFRVNSKASG